MTEKPIQAACAVPAWNLGTRKVRGGGTRSLRAFSATQLVPDQPGLAATTPEKNLGGEAYFCSRFQAKVS